MDNVTKGTLAIVLSLFAILFILNICSEKHDGKGEKVIVSSGTDSSATVFKAVVDRKDAKVYNGNVIIHCRYTDTDAVSENVIRIDVLVPRVQADQLAVGDTIHYVRVFISSTTRVSGVQTAMVGFWVDEKLLTKN